MICRKAIAKGVRRIKAESGRGEAKAFMLAFRSIEIFDLAI